ncbi:uncharacterized protein ACA1_189390 [Acanthamoeba castellanii str. Neff]|uniref:Uncharacterized protein n=1 Tax=Acanthamoeba castellanii (strain ATCC 30010 / Neff) TaxID=1257118 RepID=L8GEI8_ACACF|nr:uncharacterized protein ACA1_189390 [Acanthamoeba castellanii str. Neff]ELR11284.1 hypothetical protein ACA1_189390 [Acanthamoeba castellanii str. Neff]
MALNVDVAALQECVAGLASAVLPVKATLITLARTAHWGGDDHDSATLRAALAQESLSLEQQRARCAWLQRQCTLIHRVAAWRERLSNSLADDALAVKDALLDVTPLILPQGTVTTTGQPPHSSPETPNAVGEAGMGLLQELSARCKTCWSRHMDVRAGNMEPMFEYAARAKLSQDPTADVELTTEENEADEGLFHFPHFLLSLARTIDKLIAALQVHNVVKKQLTEKANKIKDELSSTSSAAASLRTFTGFLDSLAEDVNRLWILTGTVFSVQGPAGKETPGYSSLLSATYDASRSAVGGLAQAISDAVSNAVLPLLRIVAAKSTRTPLEALQFPFELLKRFIAFYGDPYGPLYFTAVQLREVDDLEQLAKDVLGVLEEQQPLRDAVGSVLKAIKPALDDASVSDEFAMQQVWSEGRESSHMVKGMTDLFDTCSLVAALSRHTSHRTNSETTLAQFLTSVLRAGQQTKGAATKVALGKFGQYLQRKEEPSVLGSSPNFLPPLAKTFYALHMPSFIPALLSSSSSSSASSSSTSSRASAKAERSLLV